MNTIQGKFFELTRSIFFFLAAAAFCSAARAETVLYVPGAGHLSTASGITWQTDIRLFNPGSDAISVALAFLPPGLDNSNARETTVSVSPSRSLVLADVVASTFSTSGLGAVRLRSAMQFLATSETYSVSSFVLPGLSGLHTNSVVVPAVDAATLSPCAMIFASNDYGQIESGPLFRLTYSNLGLVNPGTASIEVAVAIVNGDTGVTAGSKTISLAPGGFLQTGDIFSALGVSANSVANAIVSVSANHAPIPCECPIVDCCPAGPPAPLLAYLTVRGSGVAWTTFSLAQSF
jgi:hypothetical protein